LRQTTSRSPGNSGLRISARSRSSEQRQLEVAGLDEAADRGTAQAAHPADPADLAQALDPGAREHPPVADEDDVAQAEPVAQLGDLGLERGRIGGVAAEGLDRDRAAPLVGQQAEHDLGPVRASVAGMAVRRERAMAALQVRARQVVQDERARAEMAGGEAALDAVLAAEQPVHRPVQLVLGRVGDPEAVAERALAEERRAGELGGRLEDALADEAEGEVPQPGRPPVEERRQLEPAGQPEDRRGMTVGGAAHDPHGVARRQVALAAQPAPDELDERLGQVGQVGERPLLDLAVLAVRGAEQVADVLAAALPAHDSDHVHRAGPRLGHASSMHTSHHMSRLLLPTYHTVRQPSYRWKRTGKPSKSAAVRRGSSA
jgi:hypothetical protein